MVYWSDMVLRDFRGEVIVFVRKKHLGIISALHAELVAIYFGMDIIRRQHIRAQFVESDSLLVIDQRDKAGS